MPKFASKANAPIKSFHHVCAENVDLSVTGDVLTITIDLKKDFGLSKSGKTTTVGSTGGFVALGSHPGTVVSLNVNRK